MDLSIIVPIYNVEKYLEKCILSVLNTKLSISNYEILLINDGSTDNSPHIGNKFEKNYKNIRLFHKENGGLSDARNYGLLKAKGKYVAFVDSDDFVIKDAFYRLIDNALSNDADIVLGNAFKYVNSDNIYLKYKRRHKDFIVQDGKSFLVESIKNNTMSMSVVLGVYKREFLLNENLFFKKNILHEDELWTPITYLKAKKIVYINHNFYYHYERQGSITQKKDKEKNALDLISICYNLDSLYNQVEDWKSRKILKDYLCMLYLNAIYIGKLHEKEYKGKLDSLFPIKRAWSLKNRIKSILFMFNKNLYYTFNQLIKD